MFTWCKIDSCDLMIPAKSSPHLGSLLHQLIETCPCCASTCELLSLIPSNSVSQFYHKIVTNRFKNKLRNGLKFPNIQHMKKLHDSFTLPISFQSSIQVWILSLQPCREARLTGCNWYQVTQWDWEPRSLQAFSNSIFFMPHCKVLLIVFWHFSVTVTATFP